MQDPPEGAKTIEMRANTADLISAMDTNKLTAEWAPTGQARDVSGPQVLSCAGF